MSVYNAKELIRIAQESLDDAMTELTYQPEHSPAITTPEDFDQALAAAVPGDTLVLATAFRYEAPLTLPHNQVTICSERLGYRRITKDEPCPTFTRGITLIGAGLRLVGLEARDAVLDDIVVMKDAVAPILHRCRVLGDPVQGSKRGITPHGTHVAIVQCWIDDCYGPYPSQDMQALNAWDTPGPIALLDNYWCGGTETIMFGGSDPRDADHVPSDILIDGNTITKNPAWQQQAVSVKNILEFKLGKRVTVRGNDISQSWGGKGQDGYAILLTPRNQGGKAPYSEVSDVVITGNRIHHAAAALNCLGADNNYPSQRLARVTICDNVFEDLDPVAYTGTNKIIMIARGPLEMAIQRNRFIGVNFGSNIFFDSKSQLCEELVVTDNEWSPSTYGVAGSGSKSGVDENGIPYAWHDYVISGSYANNVTV